VFPVTPSLPSWAVDEDCHLGLGNRRTGKQQEAQEHLTTETTMYREMGMTYRLEKADAEQREAALVQ
jgi:hypothetical protein